MKIYNTMTREKEEFVPLHKDEVRIYICGPTVYNYIHVGNARPLCVFDTLRRYFLYRGYDVNFVSNITDIDDKIIMEANRQGVTAKDIAEKYEKEFLTDADGLNIMPPTSMPRATEHVDSIVTMIQEIIDGGYGYVAENGDVYFRARQFDDYGKLSNMSLDELEGDRDLAINLGDGIKENPSDFAVWKAAKPGEPAWDSPWSKGRPGWHIECSAMSKEHLGATVDIHGGGQDLIFPHHENEIAQSECVSGETFARYWMHNGFLHVDDSKMSKSLGNFSTVREVAEEVGYEPIRYFMISAHYRTPINFSMDIMHQQKQSLERLYTGRENLDFAIKNADDSGTDALYQKAVQAEKDFCERMDDDLNTADALAVLFDLVRDMNTESKNTTQKALQDTAEIFDALCGVLGLLYHRETDSVPQEILDLADEREAARQAKDYQRADEIRDALHAKGYQVEDTSDGPKVNKLS